MRAVHDDSLDEVSVVLPDIDINKSELVSWSSDPFNKSLEKVKDYSGLSATTKRRITRKLQKSVGIVGSEKPLAEGRAGASSKALIDKYATGYGAFDVVEPDYNLDYLAKLYEISPAHRASVDAKITNIVGLGYHFIESLNTKEKLSEISDEEELLRVRGRINRSKRNLENWLTSLNNEETFIETLRKFLIDYETIGNGYLEIGRTVSGEVGYIGHIPATTVRRRIHKDGYVQIVAGRTTFFRNFQDFDMNNPIGDDARPNELIHIAKYTPTNSYYGIPDIISARNAVAGEEFASRFNLDYFEHKAVPRYIIVVKNARLSGESEKKLVNFLQTGLKGQHHRTIYVPLPADSEGKQVEFKLEPIEASITDASFTKYKTMNRDEILMAHRVPLAQVGNMSGGIGASRDASRMFKEQVCRPIQDIIEKRLAPFFKEKTNAFEFVLNELTLTDEETSSRINERYLRWDVVSPNEVRDDIGMNAREGGDQMVGIFSQKKGDESDTRRVRQSESGAARDAERSGGPDAAGSDRSRNSSGEGRQTE
jgi:PBSX family phage portal protein